MPWRTRHRGPYRLQVIRPYVTKAGFYRSELLPGTVEPDDIPAEARALLSDSRDRIVRVHVWSERETQFVMTFRQEDTA